MPQQLPEAVDVEAALLLSGAAGGAAGQIQMVYNRGWWNSHRWTNQSNLHHPSLTGTTNYLGCPQ
ncbi:MAG: hypothetical protein U5K54_19330 [Cytophagales bacterium]|nr:hypothetical protein [Cytophagales bacterium]